MESPQIPVHDDDRSYKIYNMYKRPENLETSLSSRDAKAVYAMNDQTFHTPSFGDEEFDIPLIHGQHAASTGAQNPHLQYTQLHHSAPQVGMMNPAQDGLSPPGGAPSYQQPLYLQEPHTPVTSHSAGAPAGNYIIQQQPGGQQQLLMMQPSQVINGPPAPSTPSQPTPVYGSPQRASPPGTTSDDSDDSVPSHSQLPGDAESLLPIHYCSASRQQQTTLHQMGVSNMGVKRSSPEPMENGMNRGQMQKKPKIQKKKKKRDPNEPQKPVSAYALFFRDTQAAIKGQNPNASFGEVSKIVASMWDGLDSEHKSVYKQKTEVAKKEYLKALAAYRASLVSKSGEPENPVIYNHNNSNTNYGNYYAGQGYGNGHSPQAYGPNSTPQGYSPQNFPGQNQSTYSGGPQTYPTTPQQSPQNYQGKMPHPSGSYQGVPSQTPQGYQINPASSPQNCQPNMAQSPRSYQNAQSPNYVASAAISPQAYRQVQSQSPPMAPGHPPMPYHHSQQMQQAHQVQQYQQQQQIQNQQQAQQQQQQQQAQIQHQQTTQQQQTSQQHQPQQQLQPQQQHQPQQQQHQPQQQQHQPQQQQQQQSQQSQPPSQSTSNSNDQQSSSGNGNPGMPQQNSEQNESRSAQACIRQGCKNPAIANSGWEDEYCSNECVVNHCRDVFSSWVASNSNNQMQNFSAVK